MSSVFRIYPRDGSWPLLTSTENMNLPTRLAEEIAALAARYGTPRSVVADLPDGAFSPLTKTDRIGEVCMVIRRPGGRLITARKNYYPPGTFRLLTGGIKPGESIEAALLRETQEETGLDFAVRRFLAMIAYRVPGRPAEAPAFYTFAFLIDELGGVLASQDPDEQVESFREVELIELPAMAEHLSYTPDGYHPEISGSWRSWGMFRAVAHHAVVDAMRPRWQTGA